MKNSFAFIATTCFLLSISLASATLLPTAFPAMGARSTRASVGADSTTPATESREKFDPTRDAARDIADAIVLASKDSRRILLDVGGEWCIWCHKLDKFFNDNKDAAEFLHANFIVVKVNYSKENKNEKVLSAYPPVKGYPHLFVLDSSGKLLHSQDTGKLESGDHHDHDKVLSFLKAWAPHRQ